MNKTLIGATLVAALSSSALADEPVTIAFRNPVQPKAASNAGCSIAAGVLQIGDFATTRDIIRAGGYERNPLVPAKSNLGAALYFAGTYLLVRRLAPRAMCGLAVMEAAADANNVRALAR